jgi:penicillin-binding protein 1A
MVQEGYVTKAQAKKLKPARLNVERVRDVPTGTYFADWVLPMARERGEAEYGEQEVQTTLEAKLQKLAIQTVRRAPLGKAQIAMVAMRPDGRIVAMVGGKDYARSPFNRATQARRQPGSAFKLFVYLAAMRSGMSPESMIEDTPLRVDNWQPKNYGDKYRGTLTLRDAFALSSNVAAVRLSERVGRQNVIRAARDLGVTSPLADNPSLPLGTSGVTLLELTSAYAAVAAQAYPVKPRGLEEQDRAWWQRAWNSATGTSSDSAFGPMRDLLGAVVTRGTGRGAALSVPAYGKTGTSQDSRDALFIGFTDDLVVGVWVGNDDNSPLGDVAGGGLPARIWRDFTSQAVGSRPAAPTAPAIAAPAEEIGPAVEGNLAIPIEGTGYEVGVGIDGNGFTVSVGPDGQPAPPVEDGDEPPVPPEGEGPVAVQPPGPSTPRGDRGRGNADRPPPQDGPGDEGN